MKASTKAAVSIAGFVVLVGLTLDNTRPYRGDEAYYIASSIEMVHTGDILVPRYFGEARFQKPILTYWLTALGYQVAGIHLWSGRLPFLLLAAALLALVHRFSRLLSDDPELAWLNVALLGASTLFIESARVSMSDLPLAFFTTLSLFYYCRALEATERRRALTLAAALAAGAAVATKGPFGLLAPAAVATYLLARRPAGWSGLFAALSSPVNVLALLALGGAWYGYAWWAHGPELARQAGAEAEASFALRPLTTVAHVVFYLGVLFGLHVPAVAMALFASVRRPRSARGAGLGSSRGDTRTWSLRHLASWPKSCGPLACAVLLCMVAASLLLLRHKERYLLIVTPAIVMLSGVGIHRAGLARRARGVALVAALLQLAVFLAYPLVVGRPLNALVRHWDRHLEGGLASALSRRETSWADALSGGRVSRDPSSAAYLLIEDTGRPLPPGHEIVRTATERSRIWWENGRVQTQIRTLALVKRPAVAPAP